jgi:hypothetical protein
VLDISTLSDAADVNPLIKFLAHTVNNVAKGARDVPPCHVIYRVWLELDYRIDIFRVTKGGHFEHMQG